MIVTSKISMDLQKPGIPQTIHAVQDDRYSRSLEISLYSGEDPWFFPMGASVLIRYVKADGTRGSYSLLPDGGKAWTYSGNVLTVALAPQVLTAPGIAALDIMIFDGETSLSTFQILLDVSRAIGTAPADSENYFNMDSQFIIQALGYKPVSPHTLHLGIHTDGLLYLFVDGIPRGSGILITGGGTSEPDNSTAILGNAILDFTILA